MLFYVAKKFFFLFFTYTMKITAINNIHRSFFKKTTFNRQHTPELKNDCFEYQNKNSSLTFEKKMPSIDLLRSIGEENFPNETILNLARENAINGRDLDLFNIHNSYYSQLTECTSLDEAKELYPEFSDVIDAKTLPKEKLSRKMLAISKGEIEGLSLENLSLELLKRQYALGLGVNKADKYGIRGNALFFMLDALNIGRLNGEYTKQLRTSSPDAVEKHANSLRQHYIDHPEDKEKMSIQVKKVFENPEIREKTSRAIRESLKDENVRKRMSEAQKEFNRNHPESAKAHSERMKKQYEEHPEKRIQQSAKMKTFYKEHPEAVAELSEKGKQFYINHPEKRIAVSERMKVFHKEHPEYSEILSIASKEVKSELMSRIAKGDNLLKGILLKKKAGEELTDLEKWHMAAFYKKCLDEYPDMNKDTGKRVHELFIEKRIKKPKSEE